MPKTPPFNEFAAPVPCDCEPIFLGPLKAVKKPPKFSVDVAPLAIKAPPIFVVPPSAAALIP